MRRESWATLPVILFFAVAACAQNPDLSGKWQVLITHHGQPEYALLTLNADGVRWAGEMFGRTIAITANGTEIEVHCQTKDPKDKDCGVLSGRLSDGVMSASGKLFEEEATWKAQRAPSPERAATRHEFVPTVYYNQFSGRIEPVLHIKPGDTVHTTTVDAGGVDSNGVHVAAGGNPLTGPFYVDGAWPGETLVVKLKRVRLNRDTAGIYSNSVVLSALDPYYARDQKKIDNFDSTWKLERDSGIAEVVDPRVHVVAKVAKSALKPLEPAE